jgi:hypothetical protein
MEGCVLVEYIPQGDIQMFVKKALLSTAALILPLGTASAQQVSVPDTGAGATVGTTVDTTVQATTPDVPDTGVAAEADVNADANAPAAGAVVAVTIADVKAGAMVHDTAGGMVGTVETADASGAVIATGKSRVKIPIASLGKNDKGLVIAMTKAQLDAEAAAKPS